MAMTRYELKEKNRLEKELKSNKKKEARRIKRMNRKQLRKDKRAKRRFLRKSSAKYKLWHRIIIKLIRVGGPVSAFVYVTDKLLGTFEIESEVIGAKLDLDNAVMLLFFGSVVFMAAVWYGFKYLKTAIAANAVARNQGVPSLSYSPVVITFIRAILACWFFALMWLFNYIGLHYGESLNNGMDHMMIAFCIGFGSLLFGDIVEQSILHKVRNQKHESEDETREMIYNLTHQKEEE